jgi:hypothetical protein
MGGIFQTDALLKSVIEATLEDVRNNLWLLDHILEDFTHNPLLKTKYGSKQIQAAKEYFSNNNVNVQLQFSKDKEKFPAIFLTLGSSNEVQELRTMGDIDTTTLTFMPPQVGGQKIPYVVPPFIPTSYDTATGTVGVPVGVDIAPVSAGMVLLNPTTGSGTPILGISGQDIMIQPNLNLDASQLGVVPQYRTFQSRLGRSFFQEAYNMTIATDDPQSLLWLWSVVTYGLLRYREYMEHNGFLETHFNSTDIFTPEFSNAGGEEIYCRQITMFGKVDNNFIRGLHRKIESILLRSTNPEAVTLANPDGYVGGIRIVSNSTTPALEQNDTNWYTVDVEDEED